MQGIRNVTCIGVCLDIDGVLLRGAKVISGAKNAVGILQSNNIPFAFVTNGGGMLETAKAQELEDKLEVSIHPDQIVLCHTPIKSLSPAYSQSKVLIIGKPSCVDVAKSYGFHQAIGLNCVHSEHPHIFPGRVPNKSIASSADSGVSVEELQKVKAAMIFHDPHDWGLEMQVLSDVLVDRTDESAQRIPLISTNADMVYNNEFPYPRFTQGAFVSSFKHLYESYHGHSLQIKYFGKPYKVQYSFAEEVLRKQAAKLGQAAPTTFFGIGDNPRSDIRGANNAGVHWKSVLVRTGIFNNRSIDNDGVDPADHVCENVEEAVRLILNCS